MSYINRSIKLCEKHQYIDYDTESYFEMFGYPGIFISTGMTMFAIKSPLKIASIGISGLCILWYYHMKYEFGPSKSGSHWKSLWYEGNNLKNKIDMYTLENQENQEKINTYIDQVHNSHLLWLKKSWRHRWYFDC